MATRPYPVQVLKECGNGMGYMQWLQVDRSTTQDVIRYDRSDSKRLVGGTANIHPVIRATEYHAANIDCNVGDFICGVRWYS
jgi:hypothetical protein